MRRWPWCVTGNARPSRDSVRLRGICSASACTVYGSYQPHFLREFIVDNTDPDQSSTGFVESAEMRALVDEASAMLARWEADSAGE